MKRFLLLSLLFIFSCGGDSDDENASTDNAKIDFPNYIDSNSLRIFCSRRSFRKIFKQRWTHLQ